MAWLPSLSRQRTGVTGEELQPGKRFFIPYCWLDRARLLREELTLKTKAAICLAKNVRGFLQRMKFAEIKKRHHSAIKIQALYRLDQMYQLPIHFV